MTVTDEKWMQKALDEAQKGIGRTHPNPRVGAVIVKNDQLLAAGFHHQCGGYHAEIEALNALSDAADAQGATIYVTLEPCAAQGRTPACSAALLAAGISRLVYASTDPNPSMAGGGAMLNSAGLEVCAGVLQAQADALNRPFFHYIKTGLPWLIAKAAISLDGKLATHTQHSQWISGAQSRQHAHQLRAESDAIVIGVGTLLHDNPSLTVRDAALMGQPPLRVVMAREAPALWADCQLLSADAKTRMYVTIDSEAAQDWRDAGVDVVCCPDLKSCFQHLADEGCLQVMVEGGGKLHALCFEAKLSNELLLYQAPLLIGGSTAVNLWHGLGVAQMHQAPHIHPISYTSLGVDMLIRGDITYKD